jgi:hypothetical protein
MARIISADPSSVVAPGHPAFPRLGCATAAKGGAAGDDAVVAGGDDDIEGLRPYLALAREIQAEVERIASGGAGAATDIDAALDAVPRRERERVARAVFDRLPPDQQWAVLERVFDDDEIRAFLVADHQAGRDEAARRAVHLALARTARDAGRIDLGELPAGVELTLGLFAPRDVHAAVGRGRRSSVCARQLVVRTAGPDGVVHVLEDVFNPQRGFFVTPDYDEAVWATERLTSHTRARLGARAPTGPDGGFEPALYPGGRVDVEVDGVARPGHLHLGFALVGDEDVFAAAS